MMSQTILQHHHSTFALAGIRCFTTHYRLVSSNRFSSMAAQNTSVTSETASYGNSKTVWVWTKNKQVMTAAVERGWNTFISESQKLSDEWSSMALIEPHLIREGEIYDSKNRRVATIADVFDPKELEGLQPENWVAEKVVVDLLDWQVIPAENIVASFQGSQKMVSAVSKTSVEAQVFFEALEHGLGGVVLRVEDVQAVLDLKEYFDRRDEVSNILSLTKAIVTKVQVVGMGDRVSVDLCSLMRPGEGLLKAYT